MMMGSVLPHIDRSWTLFLDRDGVVNKRILGGYVLKWDEFEFLDGVLDAFSRFSELFGRILVVTNQQGIGKGLMTEGQVADIHDRMIGKIKSCGGRVDNVIVCGQLASEPNNFRKPNPTMAFMAKEIYPEIDFSKSIMVGDSDSDVMFGRNAGMITVKTEGFSILADFNFDSLSDFSKHLR